MSRAFYCEICDGDPDWRLERVGDAVVTWSCSQHLGWMMEGLQRLNTHTEVVVKPVGGTRD